MQRLILKLVDYFVPDNAREEGLRIRARGIIIMISFSAIALSGIVVWGTLSGKMPVPQRLLLLFYIGLQSGFLIMIKKMKWVEWSAFTYCIIVYVAIASECLVKARSMAFSGFQLIPLTLFFAYFIIADRRKIYALFAVSLGLIAFIMSTIAYQGTEVLKGAMDPLYQTNYFAAVTSRITLSLVALYWYVKVKNLGARDLDEQLNAKLQAAKLFEFTSLVRSMFPDLDRPLEKVQTEIEALSTRKTLISTEDLVALDAELLHMKGLASSISWIYKAYRNDRIGSASSHYLNDQLRLLLLRKLRSSAMPLKMEPNPDEFHLSGPIPTLFLLQIKLIDQIQRKSEVDRDEGLSFGIRRESAEVSFELSWLSLAESEEKILALNEQEIPNETFSPDFILEETLRDLLVQSEAQLSEFHEGKLHTLKVKGAWLN